MTVSYKHKPGHIKLALVKHLLDGGFPLPTAFQCAIHCVDNGRTPGYWRDQLGDEAADAIDSDLKDMIND